MQFQGRDVIEVRAGQSQLLIDPQGGRLLRWQHEGRPVIHWPDDADWSAPTRIRGGNPVLFPFLGRHFVDGALGRWRDADGTVRQLPMHGFAREQLHAVETGAQDCVLTLRDSAATHDAYPFRFEFRVHYALSADGKTLTTVLTTTNTGTSALPYYAGHHFYFAIPHAERSGWSFDVDASAVLRQNADGSLRRLAALPNPLNLADPAIIDAMHLLGSQKAVALRHAASGRELVIHLEAPDSLPWNALTSWTEFETSDFYCLEPWLGLPDAIHHGEGLRWLAPGATEQAVCRLALGQW